MPVLRRTFLQWLGLSPILAGQDSKVWDKDPILQTQSSITNVLETSPRQIRSLEYLLGTDSIAGLPKKFNQLVDAVKELQRNERRD